MDNVDFFSLMTYDYSSPQRPGTSKAEGQKEGWAIFIYFLYQIVLFLIVIDFFVVFVKFYSFFQKNPFFSKKLI